ncbi:MAG: hypothetical protein ABMA02_04205 [Saprospiraceae bacterium]
MSTIRLILNVPFMRYPAGTVFELPKSNDFAGWDDDERVREKQNFSGKRAYRLPDGGRGYPVDLWESDTSPCPITAFDEVALNCGPCRVTAALSGMGDDLIPCNEKLPFGPIREDDASLVPVNGINAQGIRVLLPQKNSQPEQVLIRDVLYGTGLRTIPAFGPDTTLDLSELLPGFYEALFRYKGGCVHGIRFIKSFPLLIFLERGSGRFTTQQTLY